jgi:hypothetical protein
VPDQGDIVQLSRVWTGWTTEFRAPADISNPFAPRSTVYKDPNVTSNLTALTTVSVTNTAGAQTAIRALAVEVRKLASNADERVRQDTGLIRLLLGDFYGDVSVLQTEDGT